MDSAVFNTVASGASIASLVMTWLLMLKLNGLRKALVFDRLIPERLQKLRDINTEINDLLQAEAPNWQEILNKIAQAETFVSYLADQSGGTRAKETLKTIKIYRRSQAGSRDGAWDVYRANLQCVDAIDMELADRAERAKVNV